MTYIIAYVKTQKNKIHNPLCQTYSKILIVLWWNVEVPSASVKTDKRAQRWMQTKL